MTSAVPVVEEDKETLYSISEAAKSLEITYHRVVYAISKRWMIPYQTEPTTLLPQSELDRYRREHLQDGEENPSN